MFELSPCSNDYWEDKRVDMRRIEVPAYVAASFSTNLHTIGSFRGFEEIPHHNKWYYSQQCKAFLLLTKTIGLLSTRLKNV